MNYLTYVNSSKTTGTSYQGEVTCSYKRLVRLFGEPHTWDMEKTDAEWDIEFNDGTIATIYNWKNGPNYLGEYGTPVEEIVNWHIGGFSEQAERRVQEVVNDL